MTTTSTIPEATALSLEALITPTEHGIASRILSKTAGGSLTLFAFDAGQELAEHTAPFDALVMVLSGRLVLTIGAWTSSRHLEPWCECPRAFPTRSRRPSRRGCC